MQDQDRQTGQDGEPEGFNDGRFVRVPAGIVDGLRRGAFAVIGAAGEAINEFAFAKGRGEHPEWFRAPADALEEMYAFLDVIGWTERVPPVSVEVFLWADGHALMKASKQALDFAEADASEAARTGAEPVGRTGSGDRGAESERVGVLREFIAVVQPRVDVLERGGA
jgi:hypothetical protein